MAHGKWQMTEKATIPGSEDESDGQSKNIFESARMKQAYAAEKLLKQLAVKSGGLAPG